MMLSSRSFFLAVTLIATVLQPVLAQSPTQKQIQACANSIILETYESPVTYYTDDTTHFFNATYSYNPALCVSPRVPINRLYLANLVSGINLNCPITQFTSSGLTSTQCSRSFADMAVAAQDGNTDWNIVIQVGVRPTLYTIDNEFTVIGSDPPPPPPVPSGRKRHFRRKAGPDLHCQIGESFCWTGTGRDFACMDTSSDVTACGSCPFDEDAVDCTSIPGVSDVQCRQSSCYVSKCERGYQVSSDRTTCVRTAETIPTRYRLR